MDIPIPDRDAAAQLEALNACPEDAFVAALGEVVEHSPWVVRRVAPLRPFASVWALHAALAGVLRASDADTRTALLQRHPELAGREAGEGTLTADSNREQSRLGLDRLSAAEHARLRALNTAYRERFGFPFITAVRLHADLASIFAEGERRLANAAATEAGVALTQVAEVVRGRLAQRFGIAPGWLSTHVLDAVAGLPAAGVALTLSVQHAGGWCRLGGFETDAEGRCPLLLCDDAMRAGTYQIEFRIGDYFRSRGHDGGGFLDTVPVRFVVSDAALHYHVPLLCTPASYTTYRGS
ncbi:MAG: 2-oxo-4-hydroxy-4-carboxy-5-ureidoimidazoline decarboxylase [Proteobacteria bacterium]|nr:2-oxo-4-hydroxy-4-carboxy-5-ureidoimidazoline decarboxylase [Pseudomonadota bacterium]